MGKFKYYAVRVGREPGVYTTWPEAEKQVKGYPGARYKSFPSKVEAEAFVKGTDARSTPTGGGASAPYTKSKPSHRADLPSNSTATQRRIVVYTDGSSLGNGKVGCQAGYGVYWGPNDPRNVSERLVGKQTNQRGELMAAIVAVERCWDSQSELEIRTDSQYVINSMTKWVQNWEKKNWISSSGTPVENKDLHVRLRKAILTRPGRIIWTHVQAHVGHEGNEAADVLAKAGAMKPLPLAATAILI